MLGVGRPQCRPILLKLTCSKDSRTYRSFASRKQPNVRQQWHTDKSHKEKVSLWNELFPEKTNNKDKAVGRGNDNGSYGPKPSAIIRNELTTQLPLPTVDELFQGFRPRSLAREVAQQASSNAFQREKTAVLVLQAASKSLTEEDFRCLVPKGKHIEGWTGPGNIQKSTLHPTKASLLPWPFVGG